MSGRSWESSVDVFYTALAMYIGEDDADRVARASVLDRCPSPLTCNSFERVAMVVFGPWLCLATHANFFGAVVNDRVRCITCGDVTEVVLCCNIVWEKGKGATASSFPSLVSGASKECIARVMVVRRVEWNGWTAKREDVPLT